MFYNILWVGRNVKMGVVVKYDDLVIEIDADCIIKVSAPDMGGGYAYMKYKDDFYIVYEDVFGHIICVVVSKKDDTYYVQKEVLLYSRRRKFDNKIINAYFRNKELFVLFSVAYKNMFVINLFSKSLGILVFDVADNRNFLSIQKNNGDIVVFYQKNRKFGFSTASSDGYTDFQPISEVKNPQKLYNLDDEIFLLSYDRGFVLTNIEKNEKYILPIVFGQKPEIFVKNDVINLKYLSKGRREIIYVIKENRVTFLSEKTY